MRLFIALAITFLVVLFSDWVRADQYIADFVITGGPAETVVLFERVGDELVIIEEGPGNTGELPFEIDPPPIGCRTLFMAAKGVGDASYGPYSNVVGICARYQLPDFYQGSGEVNNLNIRKVN